MPRKLSASKTPQRPRSAGVSILTWPSRPRNAAKGPLVASPSLVSGATRPPPEVASPAPSGRQFRNGPVTHL
eukprot:7020675-Pyramimonas_sp.AAC.2